MAFINPVKIKIHMEFNYESVPWAVDVEIEEPFASDANENIIITKLRMADMKLRDLRDGSVEELTK